LRAIIPNASDWLPDNADKTPADIIRRMMAVYVDVNYQLNLVLAKGLMQHEAGLDKFQYAVDYLLQSNYVTGRVLPVDGGRHLR
jgi:dihydromonapterin reductase/dihydrofolate reductase